MESYYLQDKRSFVGNDMVFWAEGRSGYTTDVSKAHVFTKEEAFRQHRSRPSDVPWPKAYIDAKTRPAVDFQYVNINEALKDSGEILVVEVKEKRPKVINCVHCGKFISLREFWGDCPHCDGDNRP